MVLFITANENEDIEFSKMLKNDVTETLNSDLGSVVCKYGDFGKYKVAYYYSPNQGSKALIGMLSVISAVKPSFVILVGIACAGMDRQQQIGQVLLSKRILDYNERKEDSYETADGVPIKNTILRGDIVPTGDMLNELFFGHYRDWKKKSHVNVYYGDVISSDFLLNNYDVKKEVFCLAKNKTGRSAIGYEMEGAPAFEACHRKSITELFIVKGISDFGDGTKNQKSEEEQNADQLCAAQNAVSLCHYIFSQDNVFSNTSINRISQQANDASFKKKRVLQKAR